MKIGNFILILSILLVGIINLFAQSLLNPATHPKFKNPLPVPVEIDATGGGTFDMYMEQTQQWLGLVDAGGTPLMTTVWGYGPTGAVTYPGPTFFASKNQPVYVNWYNNLPGHFLPVDPSLHMAHPNGIMTPADVASWYGNGNVPTVAHLHGGHTESASDGLPEQWFTQGVAETGNYFAKTNYVYDNDQEAATLWYHDHALGITRLNVYAGLAGFYLLDDNHERQLVLDGILPKGKHDFEIVIQDKDFYDNGELFWPANPSDPPNTIWNPWEEFIEGEGVDDNPLFNQVFPNGGPTALAEFFGDFIVVNGTVWPYLDVEPRKYRFRLLNGSDSRFYVLKLFGIDQDGNKTGDAIPFLQIATDDGLLPAAIELTQLVIAPGERAEIVVDFEAVGMGNSIRFFNFGPDSPFGGLPVPEEEQANPSTTGQIMQFNVNQRLKVNQGLPKATVSAGDIVRDPITPLVADNPSQPRKLGLFEGSDEYGRLQPLLGAFIDSTNSIESLTWDDEITENPYLNATEEWEVYNFTGDAHPVHLHLVAFQIINRQPIDFEITEKDQLQHSGENGIGGSVEISDITPAGPAELPAENERGWKDTFIVPPGYVGRVIAKFDRLGRYVWHCHILSHEDHEMMRPYEVIAPLPDQGIEIAETSLDALVPDTPVLEQNYPNPFNPTTEINFSIPEAGNVQLVVYNTLGQEVITLARGYYEKGSHNLMWDARDNFGNKVPSGVYIYRLTGKDFIRQNKMMLIK
jgi:spore coat protein A